MNSSQTIEDESDDMSVDELYRGGTSESKSYDEVTSPVNPLRLSGRQLSKPQMSPKSFNSDDDNEIKLFSQGTESQFLMYGASNR